MLEKLILGMLLYKNLTIYDIKKALDEGINQFFSTSFGALHPATKKLEQKGLTKSNTIVENGRTKKVYTLTKQGKAYFIEWLEARISLSKVQEEGLLRVFFYKELPKKKQTKLLGQYINEMRERLAFLQALKKQQQIAKADIPPKHREAFNYRVTIIDYGLGYYEFAIGWYSDLVAKIQGEEMKK